ncbi:polysaccharide deacetylase family protein [Bizionia paragorgiae]|uniref:polysaccharide deacetylase family protein n=1 Tax=Bizionia paragorgiae TaxID=283786 RepID=UPI00299D4023|nr:polysaccharide deacetylase family protein [Bizionia paragorgiae]MDX1271883.1 polysaccharide deacetylase family protein [Bizionia paragorgiae]
MINFKLASSFFTLICCVFILFIALELLSIWWLIISLLVGFILLGMVSFTMSWNCFTQAFTHKKTTKKIIALTFDDGPHPEYTPKVLALLKQYEAKATFFCIGKHVEKHPEIVQAIINQGHSIGNHSYTHSNTIAFKSKQGWLEEIKRTDALITKITGVSTKLFRPPFGVTTPHLAAALKVTGPICVGWNIRSFDTFFKTPKTISNRVLNHIHPGSIILLHDKQENCLPVLEHILQVLHAEHYDMVTINTLYDEK